jgi:type 1 fimbria pilin
MYKLFRISPQTALLLSTMLFSLSSRGEDIATLEVTGSLIRPPCTAAFPTSQTVEIPSINLNSLKSDLVGWTTVDLLFKCVKESKVLLRFKAGNGSYDVDTLRTTLENFGLRLRLEDMTNPTSLIRLNWDEQFLFPIDSDSLNLRLSVKPVQIGNELPRVGTYSSVLLMEIIYQ